MTIKNGTLRNGTIIGLGGLLLALGLAACHQRPQAAAPPRTTDAAAGPQANVSASSSTPGPAEAAKALPAAAPVPPRPLSPEEIEHLWMQPGLVSKDYGTRLEAVRSILHKLRSHGQVDEARIALVALLDEVEKQEGRPMAERVAFAEAGILEDQRDYPTAVMAYRLLLERYPDGPFAAEAQYHLGGAHLELHDYPAAERAWQVLIEEYDGSSFAPGGWRKLALAQLLQGQFDSCLATLELMAGKYPGTEYEDYARMRQGYVYVVAGRTSEAKAVYEAFLAQYPHSIYVRLVRQQLAALEQGDSKGPALLARVNGRGD